MMAVMKSIQSVSCVVIVITLSIILGIFLLFRVFHLERILQMIVELGLLGAHILILLFVDAVKSPFVCDLASMGIQFFFLVHFAGMFAEAFQSFTRMTNVISKTPMISARAYGALVIGFAAICTGVTAAIFFSELSAELSCWVDIGSPAFLGSVIPITGSVIAAVGYAEAAGVHAMRAYPLQSGLKQLAAEICQKWLLIKSVLSFVTYMIGAFAVYFRHAALISAASSLHFALGISMFIFHASADPKVLSLVTKIAYKIKSVFCGKNNEAAKENGFDPQETNESSTPSDI